MAGLTTGRLFLLPLTGAMVGARLECDDFTLRCRTPEGRRSVHFGPQWPGDALAAYPRLRDGLAPGSSVEGTFTVVERASYDAVGQVGTTGEVEEGAVEIGYGLNEDARGRGLATEAVEALVAHLLARPGVDRVTAETSVANLASQRVLERAGFRQVRRSCSEADGELVVWVRG